MKYGTDLTSVMSRERTRGDDIGRSRDRKEGIMTVEQARAYEERKAFWRDVDAFRADVQGRIDYLRNCGDDEREISDFYISEYEKLLGMTVADRSDLENVKWLYNYGDLRTSDEIYVHSGEFHSDCNKRSYGLPFVMFLVGFLPVLFKMISFLYDPHNPGISFFMAFIAGGVLGTIPGGILALIGCAIGETINKTDATHLRLKGIREAESMEARARTNLKATIAGGAAAAGSIGRSTKKAVKGLTDVDGWKQMK